MTDPSDLLRRAAELTERADHEENVDTRERLLRMAQHYVHIAESEEWLAAHPTSIAYGQKIETAQRRQCSDIFGLGPVLHNKLAVDA